MKAVFATLLVAAIALWAAPADAKDKKNSPNLGSSAEHRQNGAHRKGERKTGAGDAAVMSEDGGKAKTDKKAKKKKREREAGMSGRFAFAAPNTLCRLRGSFCPGLSSGRAGGG